MSNEELLDCILSVDEILSEAEEALEKRSYSSALNKIRQARDAISELREYDESEDGRQEVDLAVSKELR
jgi:flagellin-specific chaperone FliS